MQRLPKHHQPCIDQIVIVLPVWPQSVFAAWRPLYTVWANKRSARHRAGADKSDLIEEATVPCLLAVTVRRPSNSTPDPDDPNPSSFVVRHTTPVPEEPEPQKEPASPFMPNPATDAVAKDDGSSPLKSISWSSQTVEQFDDRCVQISVEEFKSIIGGKEVEGRAKRRLRSFRSVNIKNLPDTSESSKYRPLCDILNIIEEIAQSGYRWKIVANHAESSEIDHRPDLARYPINEPAAEVAFGRRVRRPDEPNIARCAWAWMSSFVEVKNTAEAAGFHFGTRGEEGDFLFLRDSEDGKIARAQIIKYATEAMLRQHRTHYYSVYIAGMSARVFRWDRVGCLVTEPIDLSKDYKTFLNILHRLATAEDNYGADSTVERTTAADILPIRLYTTDNQDLKDYREMILEDMSCYPIHKVKCPAVAIDGTELAPGAEKTYLIGRYAFGHYATFGRCTRGYAAWDVENGCFVWFKDQWRCATRPHTELEAYMRLHQHHVPFIATPIAGGDVAGHCTISQRYMTRIPEEWRPAERVHTRLVTREVGKLVERYDDSPHLLQVCFHAFIAHREAWQYAGVLHRDISVGNIMINVDDDTGFLNDWDLCKYRAELEGGSGASEPSGISGTWAFKSGHSLIYPRKPPEVADDLESFVNVLTFFGFRFHHHELSPVAKNTDTIAVQKQAASENTGLMGFINSFFYEQRRVARGFYAGGGTKKKFIRLAASPIDLYPLENGQQSLLGQFLDNAYLLLHEHYAATPKDRYAEFAVRPGDEASPDEDDPPPDGPPKAAPPKPSTKPAMPEAKRDLLRAAMARGGWSGRKTGNKAGTDDTNRERRTPFQKLEKAMVPVIENPRRVLDSHDALGQLFFDIFHDEDDNEIDLTPFQGDKRFDQFRSWHDFGWIPKRLKCGEHRSRPSDDKSTSRESAGSKRAREEDVAELERPAKRTTPSPEPEGQKQNPKATRENAASTRKQAAAPRKRATRRARKDTSVKTSVKVTASSKVVRVREPSSPRRATAVKAEITRKAAKVEVTLGSRRSQRLAAKS